MEQRFASFEAIETFAKDTSKATIGELRAALKMLQAAQSPAGSPELRQRWQHTHDLVAASLNGKLIHRRFLLSLCFGAVVFLLIVVDMFR